MNFLQMLASIKVADLVYILIIPIVYGTAKALQNPYFDSFSATIAGVSATASYTNYSYDAMARMTNVTNPDATTARVVFDRWLISTYDENGHRKDYQLDSYDRIVRVQEFNIDSVLDDGIIHGFNTTYAYDTADQLIQINDTYGNQFRFAYDSLGRRTRLNDPDIGEWNYTYDLAGNLISQAGGGGNLVSGDGFYREYNTLNQLVRIRNGSSASSPLLEQYYYDPFGDRIKIWRNDSAGTTIYTPFREFMQIRNSTGVYNFTYVYDGSTLVARVEPDNSVHYYHPDHLGSTTLITDQNGNVVEETFYEPFGAVTSGGTSDVKLYTGQFSDELTNQYYYGERYYMPDWGRFIQPDPVVPAIYNPQALNKYAYTLNNPYLFTDPNGREPVRSQAGSVQSTVNYIRSVEQSHSNPYATLAIVANTYRSYESSSISDKSSSSFAANFVYTSERGVVDNRHFFANALATQFIPDNALSVGDYLVEGLQAIPIFKQQHSFLTYEDIRSNRLGRLFGNQLDPTRSLSEQYGDFMESSGEGEFPDWLWETMPEEENIGHFPPSWKMDITGEGKALPGGGGKSKNKDDKNKGEKPEGRGCIGDICVRPVR